MRVIEPKRLKAEEKASIHIKKRIFYVITIFVISVSVYLFTVYSSKDIDSKVLIVETDNDHQSSELNMSNDIEDKRSKNLSGNEFRLLYDNLILKNTEKINTPPVITGNDIADARIRKIAESRGYKIRVVSNVELPFIGGHRLQESLREPWRAMIESANEEGIEMVIVSGYRSVDEQRDLFLERLTFLDVDTVKIAAGEVDDQVDKVLTEVAMPGYSKHHSGYTIDLRCDGFSVRNFISSPCNAWLVKDNYSKAKEFGFIPSYPADADLQGPDPEAWEYVYVGVDVLNPDS